MHTLESQKRPSHPGEDDPMDVCECGKGKANTANGSKDSKDSKTRTRTVTRTRTQLNVGIVESAVTTRRIVGAKKDQTNRCGPKGKIDKQSSPSFIREVS